MFNAEFCWTYIGPNEEDRTISIIDVSGISFSQLTGPVMSYIRAANGFYGQHYPERAHKIFIINVPMLFSAIWKIVSVMVDPVTLTKIKIVRGKKAVTAALAEDIDMDKIPQEYGGTCETPLGEAPQEKAIFEHYDQVSKMWAEYEEGPGEGAVEGGAAGEADAAAEAVGPADDK